MVGDTYRHRLIWARLVSRTIFGERVCDGCGVLLTPGTIVGIILSDRLGAWIKGREHLNDLVNQPVGSDNHVAIFQVQETWLGYSGRPTAHEQMRIRALIRHLPPLHMLTERRFCNLSCLERWGENLRA